VFDSTGEAINSASEIFTYEENPTYDINPYLLRRITNGTEIGFTQKLMNDDGSLLWYKDSSKNAAPTATVWRKGLNDETYAPIKVNGNWELPNQLNYNVHHENRSVVRYSEIYRHFRSIIEAQEVPGIFTKDGQVYHLDDSINFGIGGTIKEHNGGFDMLVSAMFVEDVSPVDVIQFAHDQYNDQINWFKERLRTKAATLLVSGDLDLSEFTNNVALRMLSAFENDKNLDRMFGDSTSPVHNWIASLCYLGLGTAVKPYVLNDSKLGIHEIVHHTGHRSEVALNRAEIELLLRGLVKRGVASAQSVPNHSVDFTTTGTEKVGQLLVRSASTGSKLYRYNASAAWDFIDLNAVLSNAILAIETKLYDNVPVINRNVNNVSTNTLYTSKIEDGFNRYVARNGITNPFINKDGYSSGDPFTWNYAFSKLVANPSTTKSFSLLAGSWQGLYQQVYGTPYPHLEPWVLQGYASQPSWWNVVYASTDATSGRRWSETMWDNILAGIVPETGTTPNGAVGNGFAGQVQILFTSVPVNTSALPTNDNIRPDELIPPYWNTSNTTDARVKPLFDANQQHDVVTPQLDYEFGINGVWEWKWRNSLQYQYDKLIATFQLDPMNFINATFDAPLVDVNSLEVDANTHRVRSHRDVTFHGDFVDSTNSNYISNGLNQWYVHHARYNSLDGDNSELRAKWKAWEAPLTYISGSFIEPKSLRLVSDAFDITEKDYRVAVKKSTNVDVKRLSSLNATLYSVPSKYSQNREAGIGWTASFTPKSDVGSMSYFPVQNFPFRSVSGSDVLEINAYSVAGAEIVAPRGYRIANYNQSLELSSNVFFDGNANSLYSATVVIDGINTISLNVPGNLSTVRAVIDFINLQFGGLAEARIELGNLVIESNTMGVGSTVDMTVGSLFPNILPVAFGGISDGLTTGYAFNRAIYVNGNYTSEFTPGAKFTISGSTTLNGNYTVTKSIFDVATSRTMIVVAETLIPTSNVVDGVIRVTTGRTLPASWVTGKEVYLNSVGVLPLPFDEYTPYYVVRLSDTTFKLAETSDAAVKGLALVVENNPANLSYVGSLERTFKALGGQTSKYNWRRHDADERHALTMPSSMSVSGIQCMVDFLVGYETYAKSIGFDCLNPDGDNRDADTNLSNSWQTETEKFIDWMFTIRTLRHEDNLKYHVTPNNANNSFSYVDSVTFETGTAVLLLPDDGGTLPTRFNNIISQNTPYYVIRSTDGTSIQLATSRLDAKKGRAVDFSDNGAGKMFVQVYKKSDALPKFEVNPFKSNLWVNHAAGILSNVTDNNIARYPSRQVIFDNANHIMTVSDLHVFREDSRSRISLVGALDDMNNSKFSYTRLDSVKKPKSKKKYISGVDLRFEGYEHTIIFNDRSVDNSLIYDNFLGIRTPRFLTEMTRQVGFTLRPNMGGFILQNGELSPNFESTVSDIRYYYDVHNALEYKTTTSMVRNVLGYNGTIDYMDALQINPKTQFLFWRGMIQNKGTNLAIDAFANQPLFSDASIDEFWAYKLGEFGDAKAHFYPEVKLTVDDVVKKELRLEFTSPEGGPLDDSFAEVKLTDIGRWWNQPDVWNASQPYNTFFFDTKVTGILSNVQNDVITTLSGYTLLILSDHHDGAIITYRETENGDVKVFVDKVDFEFVNSKVIRFLTPLTGLYDVSVATLSYNEQSSGPSFVVDKTTDSIVAEIPLWNPAIGQHNQLGYQLVDVEAKIDPAVYSDSLDRTERRVEGVWTSATTGHVWMDTSIANYVPYYDRAIFHSTNERMFNWGQMADWASIKLYQWTESTIHPDDWDSQVLLDVLDINMPPNKRRGGKSYKKLYQNTQTDPAATPVWVEVKDAHYDFMAILVDSTTASELDGNHEVYVNGKYVMDVNFTAYTLHQFVEGAVPTQPLIPAEKDFIHLVQRAAVPDEEAIQKKKFKYSTPYSMVERFDPIRGANYNLYYFWVSDKQEQVELAGNKFTTITEAERQLTFNPNPYMVINGLRPGDDGYGVVFGTVFDEDDNKLPYRYTQLVIRGLNGKVKDEERYALRVCKDLTLRDSLPSGDGLDSYLSNKNVHSEWKLIREKQIYKIDTFLWDRLVEAAIGCRVVNGAADYATTLPSLNRIVFDNIYGADTRFGLGEEQVFSDRETTVATILGMLSDPTQVFTRVDISEFIAKYDFSYQSDIVDALAEIYNTFTVEEVNKIFFMVLHDAMAFKRKSSDIFKTSWVALQIAQGVHTTGTVALPQLRLVTGDVGEVDSDVIEVTPTPLPDPTPTPTPTPPVSPTPTPTPTSSVTPTPTPTPSITPSPSMVLGPLGSGLFSADHNGYISKVRTSDDTVVSNLAVSSNPYQIALNHDGTKVYVFDGSSDGARVLSTATMAVLASLPAAGGANGVARHPSNNEIYVSVGSSVIVISTISDTITATITGFTGIAFTSDIVFSPDGLTAYVTGYNDSTSYVFVLDTTTKTITTTITVGANQAALAITPDGFKVYGCSRVEGKFYIINTSTNEVATTVTVGFPITGCVFHPTNGKMYVADANGFIKVLDAVTKSVLANITVGETPVSPIFNYDYTKLYVANYNGSSISVIDIATNTVTATIPLAHLASPSCLAIARP
jgi:YVTN family beta-propeller protein